MMLILDNIRKWLTLGHLPNQPYSFENRRILLLNKIALVGILVISIIVTTHIIIGNILQPMMVSLGFLVTIPALLFQGQGNFKLARNWFLIGFFLLISIVFFHSVKLNLATNTEYVLIILIPLTLIFLDGKVSVIGSIAIIVIGAFYIVLRFILEEGADFKVLNGLVINWITASITVFFCMNFFKRSLVKANRLIEKDREKLDSANQTKNFLFGVISHDLRSPLNILKQYLLLDPTQRSSPEEFMIYQEGLTKKVDKISQTLDDLLFWSKSQLQGITVNASAVLPMHIIQKVTSIAEQLIKKKEIELRIDNQTNEKVWCDQDHLTVVIRNLLQNAIKFTPSQGKITISTALSDNHISISIIDTGKGMDNLTLKNLQDGMITKSHLGTAGEVGTGLGISLVKDLISKNRGRLKIESEPGKGTHIQVILPRAAINS